jgi:hypothetical protein
MEMPTQVSGYHRASGATIATPVIKVAITDGRFDWKYPELGEEYLDMHLVGHHDTLVGTYRSNYFERREFISFRPTGEGASACRLTSINSASSRAREF